MKIILLIFVFLGTFILVNAQTPNVAWQYQYGAEKNSSSQAFVAVDSQGGTIVVGGRFKKCDFDFGLGESIIDRGQLFIQKLNQAGELQWVKTIDNSIIDNVIGMALDQDNNICILGTINVISTKPDSLGINRDRDVFVLKFDSEGEIIWAKGFGTSPNFGYTGGQAIAVDLEGNVLVTGSFLNTINFDTGIEEHLKTSNGESDIFLLKLDQEGDFMWVTTMGDWGSDHGLDVATDAEGNIYSCGSFLGTIDADPSDGKFELTSHGYYDAYVQKLDKNGHFIWAFSQGNYIYDMANVIFTSNSNDVYVAGAFTSNVDFDPSEDELVLSGEDDIYLQKLNSAGQLQWVKTLAGEGFESPRGIFVNDKDQVFLGGEVRGKVDIDIGPGVLMTQDSLWAAILLKLDKNGHFIWGQYSGEHLAILSSLAGDNNGNIYSTGYFIDSIEFHLGDEVYPLDGPGGENCFIQKIQHCPPAFQEVFVASCQPYTAPSGKYTFEESIVFQDTIDNHFGCDSILTIHLNYDTEEHIFNNIEITPNPTSNFVLLKSDISLCEAEVKVYSLSGQEILELKIENNILEYPISLEFLPQGAYIFLVGKNDLWVAHRIIKQ